MRPTEQDIYHLITNQKLKKIAEIFHEGISGMYVVLKILDEQKKELSAGDISEILEVTTARTAVILSTLCKKGLIIKTKSKLDARKTIVKITDMGLLVLKERKQKIFDTIKKIMSRLNDDDIENFCTIMQKLSDF